MTGERKFKVVVTVPMPPRPDDGEKYGTGRRFDRDMAHLLKEGPICYRSLSVVRDGRGRLRFAAEVVLKRQYKGLRYSGAGAHDAIAVVGRAVEWEVGRILGDPFDPPALDVLSARAELIPRTASALDEEERP